MKLLAMVLFGGAVALTPHYTYEYVWVNESDHTITLSSPGGFKEIILPGETLTGYQDPISIRGITVLFEDGTQTVVLEKNLKLLEEHYDPGVNRSSGTRKQPLGYQCWTCTFTNEDYEAAKTQSD